MKKKTTTKTAESEPESGSAESAAPHKPGEKDFLLVGIGASAGGIKALQEFFAAMPADSGMAFVVILHLSPNHESNLDRILQLRTSMPVVQVNETHKVEPNRVYVIPPDKHLEMIDGIVRLAEKQPEHGSRAAIDVFFRTLAEAYRKNAVCVVLSGTGSDGTSGLKRIKESNGFAIVQDPVDAEYDQMPRSAIATGLADWVLPVAQMPEKLIHFRESSERLHLTNGAKAEEIAKKIHAEDSLREILTVLRVRTGHDFSNYKTPTLVRRIARHLQIHELEDIPSYLSLLRDKPDEVLSLQRNLLINVTNFFRDKEAFAALEKEVIPKLFAGKTARDTVRVWSAGCASGEEAYSLAMLLSEYAGKLSDPPKFQVFATDVDDEAITEAREHSYPETIEADVSEERLRRFFVKENKRHRIRKELRETVLFAPHNILRDPPFSRLDLIACRNLLIYLNRETQERVMEIYHFALAQDGYLFLGSSETADHQPDLFSIIDQKQRIYMRRSAYRQSSTAVPQMPVAGAWQPTASDRRRIRERNKTFSLGEVHFKLLERYAPPAALVNRDFEVMYMSETAGRYLRLAGGEPSNNILKLVLPDLVPDLRAALFTAQQERQASEFPNIHLKIGGADAAINLIVSPVDIADDNREFMLVVFEEIGRSQRLPDFLKDDEQPDQQIQVLSKDEAMEAVVRRLEDDLQRTRAHLRATVEQHEIAAEEYKAANEELQAINEELRSASEELETSKEEAQSVNEELTTVNHELKDKIDETTRANSDLQNLMAATDIATIFLDRDLRIKRYTPPVEELFNITKIDIGRPLEHFTHHLDYPDIQADAAQVLRKLRTIEREISERDGRFFLTRFAPYRTLDDRINGVVLNFVDITERKKAEQIVADDLSDTQILHELSTRLVSEENIQTVYDEITTAAIRLMRADAGTVQIYDETAKELMLLATSGFDRKMTERFACVDAGSNTSCGIALATGERTFVDFDMPEIKDPDGSVRMHIEAGYLSAQSTPLVSRAGKPIGMVSTHWKKSGHRPTLRELRFLDLLARQAADLIEQSRANIVLQEADDQIRAFINATSEVVYKMSADWRRMFTLIGKGFIATTESPREDWMSEYIPVAEQPRVWAAIERAIAAKSTFEFEHQVIRTDGEIGWTFSRAVPVFDRAGAIIEWFGTASDITVRKNISENLRESEERFRIATEAARMYSWEFDAQSEIYKFSGNTAEILGIAPEDLPRTIKDAYTLVHPDDLEIIERELRNALKNGAAFAVNFRSVKQSGEIIWLSVQATVIKDAQGKPMRIIGTAQDITLRKQAENLLRESEERLRIAVEAAALGTWDWNLVTDEVRWNERHFALFGMPPTAEKLTSAAFYDRVHPDDRERVGQLLDESIKTGGLFEAEFCIVRKDDGKTRWMEGYGHVVERKDGQPVRMSGVMGDITDRKRAAEIVRQSEQRLQLILQSITDYAVITTDRQGIINGWNTGAENTFGWTAAQVLGKSYAVIFVSEDRDAGVPEKELETALKNGIAEDRRWHIRHDGSRFFASGTVSPIVDGAFEGFVKITSDQTVRMEAENVVREKELLEKLVSAQEDERKRIARDLHDELGQQLTILRMKLDTVSKNQQEPVLRNQLYEIQNIARSIDDGVDFLAWELRPSTLDDLGLTAALDNYIKQWSRYSGVKAELTISNLKRARFVPEVETCLYRIVQEALNNTHKHAAATNADIVLRKRADKLILIVEDNGKGFNLENKLNRSKGMGLIGMKERATLVGGTLDIETAPGQGTTIQVQIPFARAQEGAK